MAKSPAGSSLLFNRGPLFQEPPPPPPDEGSTPPPPDGGSSTPPPPPPPDGGSTTPVNAKPPAGSSLLFGALADSGRIKQRKNGSYRMVLKGVDEIDWFTDRPNRIAGGWSPKKLLNEWDVLFSDGAPNAQATFEMGSKRKLVTFEMFKPKLSNTNQTLSFKVRSIGKKNKGLLNGLRNQRLSNASLFIDDGVTGDSTATIKVWNDSGLMMSMKSSSSNAIFGNPTNVNGSTNAAIVEGIISFNGGEEGAEGVFEAPVTLKNGLQTPPIEVAIMPMPSISIPSISIPSTSIPSPIELDPIVIPGQCMSRSQINETTTVYYTINGGNTQSVEATCFLQ
jgi:hypothetical protein